jgi:hypothetical protein
MAAAPEQPFDLNQVVKLFNHTLAAIRNNTPSNEAPEPQAIAWLKDARYKLMRDIEAAYVRRNGFVFFLILVHSYYKLERSRHAPLSQPEWAVDPSKRLYLFTPDLPIVLELYRGAIVENLLRLLRDWLPVLRWSS